MFRKHDGFFHGGFFSRRGALKVLAAIVTIPAMGLSRWLPAGGWGKSRPRKPDWPSRSDWERLRDQVGGRLLAVDSPLQEAVTHPGTAAAADVIEKMKNPFYILDHPGATQSTGWFQAWKAQVSPWAVAAESPADVAAAVKFARQHGVRLVVKGTGHDYLGRSNAADSLLVWTHRLRDLTSHDAFVPVGGSGPGVPAISAGGGAVWLEVYDEVTNRQGRFVQGGGCTSVGPAGFILGGGFGLLSKRFGSGAGSLLEAEVVLADGSVVVANEHQNADLFWALKGGGGGTFGIVTRLTLRTYELPRTVGGVNGKLTATSDAAYRELLERFVEFYPENLNNRFWGETVAFTPENEIRVSLAFVDLPRQQAEQTWQPLLDWARARPEDFQVTLDFMELPFRDLWNGDFWKQQYPSQVKFDPRPGEAGRQFWWSNNQPAVSEYIFNYKSRWLPLRLFEDPPRLADTLFQASRHWRFRLYINKGMAGIPEEAARREENTCMNPAANDAAGWILMMGRQENAFPGVPGHEPDPERAREVSDRIDAGMQVLREATPGAGTYSNEADYHEPDWQEAFWGSNYPRLLAIKRKYDPSNFFRTHHSVGSEEPGQR